MFLCFHQRVAIVYLEFPTVGNHSFEPTSTRLFVLLRILELRLLQVDEQKLCSIVE